MTAIILVVQSTLLHEIESMNSNACKRRKVDVIQTYWDTNLDLTWTLSIKWTQATAFTKIVLICYFSRRILIRKIQVFVAIL